MAGGPVSSCALAVSSLFGRRTWQAEERARSVPIEAFDPGTLVDCKEPTIASEPTPPTASKHSKHSKHS